VTPEKALALAERALKLAQAADLKTWADIGPCPLYHYLYADDCTCDEEARRIVLRDAFYEALAAIAAVKP
jgi:hypothetical protein